MKNIMKIALIALLVLAVVPVVAEAQTATYSSTLGVAMNIGQQNLTIAATTNMVVGQFIFCNGELMQVNSITGLIIGVTRGLSPTRAGTHPLGSICWYGLSGGRGPFAFSDTPIPGGGTTCVAANYAFMPQVVAATADVLACTGGRWNIWNPFTQIANGYVSVTADYTALLTDYIIGYATLTGGAKTVTLPAPNIGMRGKTYIIKNEGGVASNTIWIYGNTTLNQSTGYFGIYGTGTAGITGGSITVYTNGSAWFGF